MRIFLILLSFSSIGSFGYGQDTIKTLEQAQGVVVGTIIPDFKATNQYDSLFSLNDALKKGPVVIIFYRGQWCPFCNKHLSLIQDSLEFIYEKGAQVIAISPEKTEYLVKMSEKTDAKFNLLYDKDYLIAKQFDVLFQADKATRVKYNTFLNANLSEAHGNDSEQLPIPVTFILDQSGKIVWRQFDPNYKNRSSVAEIITHLPKN